MIRTTTVAAGLVAAAVLVAGWGSGPATAEADHPAGPAVAASPGVGGPSGSLGTPPAMSQPSATPIRTSPPIMKPRTQLTLSYEADAGNATAVELGCDPATGPHPKKKQACAALSRAGGHPGRITPARTMCYLIYAPVHAHVTGTWRGRPITWSRTYGNRCEMNRATGILFAF